MQQTNNTMVSVPEFAKLIGLSRSQVFRKVKAGQIPAQKVGGVYLIDASLANALAGIMTASDQKDISKAVKKTLKIYGETLEQLGSE
ncbi:hypothetical protein COZ61_00820 [Candidatus Berkelbacteria bacterium CG_4_8_14_3_um_filter_33_6]|uniref:Helix-turn-helix domain-containing protein n=1 Tax=Candidatus Berkelbacteria bacterium CG_4_10_14_0_2_um_filter_35_9_33_12 TaxID=1974499 RepID=A0A2M7W4I4_9BACT|nr:MAG: hypothetical protein COZ61_00820 [Candidatus Berkelbacteria bacterium CG_4_8_14_3_um_filter_33_6]PIZ28034.1 MAG: hypothetical protein COY43_02705 [Candidatus Berkelbacteria bacterium CG_4_10_14_0_8_um_filter_35_9_33_8]PJA20663.1 MAG: hypothetical protein COX60_01050 [Candidatus Berkelbacteria bacterium CG_4_10_14_0_2_um_filter_35_9_33_12]